MTDAAVTWTLAADPHRRVGCRVEFHPSIGSTNDRARELLAEPGGEGVAVVADLQTEGRGRHGRTWSSPPGRNLMVSVGLRPLLGAADAWMLSASAALALLTACEALLPDGSARLAVKWPNDLVDGAGRKLAGILVETVLAGDRLGQVVIGAGVNVNWTRSERPPELAERAIALCDLAGGAVDRVALLGGYLAALDRRLTALAAGGTPLDAYRAASWLDGREVVVEHGEGELTGRVAGIGADGALLLETDAGRVRVAHGEVRRVVPAVGVPA